MPSHPLFHPIPMPPSTRKAANFLFETLSHLVPLIEMVSPSHLWQSEWKIRRSVIYIGEIDHTDSIEVTELADRLTTCRQAPKKCMHYVWYECPPNIWMNPLAAKPFPYGGKEEMGLLLWASLPMLTENHKHRRCVWAARVGGIKELHFLGKEVNSRLMETLN